MQNFMPSLLPSVQGVTYAWATTATTLYLVGSALSLAGGWLADRTTHHEELVTSPARVHEEGRGRLGQAATPAASRHAENASARKSRCVRADVR